jgi:hypothetical protein
MPAKTATWLTPHSADICATPGVYDPAAYAVKAVIAQATHIVKFFLFSVQSKGLVYFTRSGGSGGDSWSSLGRGCIDGCRLDGWGSSVSKVRYFQTISSLLQSTPRSLSASSSSFSLSLSLLVVEAGSELLRESKSGPVFIPGVYVGCSTPNSESFARSISGLADMLPSESQGLPLLSICKQEVLQRKSCTKKCGRGPGEGEGHDDAEI